MNTTTKLFLGLLSGIMFFAALPTYAAYTTPARHVRHPVTPPPVVYASTQDPATTSATTTDPGATSTPIQNNIPTTTPPVSSITPSDPVSTFTSPAPTTLSSTIKNTPTTTSASSASVTPPSLPVLSIVSNAYNSVTHPFTPLQTLLLLSYALMVALLGLFLVEHNVLAAWIARFFRREHRGVHSPSHV